MGKGVTSQQPRTKSIDGGQKNTLLCGRDGRGSGLSHLEQREMGQASKLFMVTHTHNQSRSLSPVVLSTKASLTHPNTNFSQGLFSHLHAKLNVSRRPRASGSSKRSLNSIMICSRVSAETN